MTRTATTKTNPYAPKLTPKQREEICKIFAIGKTSKRSLAIKYGVAASSITNLLNKKATEKKASNKRSKKVAAPATTNEE
jgi:DNA invertase Pin-like site-specific DNA recombinase